MTYTDKKVNNLIFNKLTQEEYDQKLKNDEIEDDEFYFIIEE